MITSIQVNFILHFSSTSTTSSSFFRWCINNDQIDSNQHQYNGYFKSRSIYSPVIHGLSKNASNNNAWIIIVFQFVRNSHFMRAWIEKKNEKCSGKHATLEKMCNEKKNTKWISVKRKQKCKTKEIEVYRKYLFIVKMILILLVFSTLFLFVFIAFALFSLFSYASSMFDVCAWS